MKEIGEECKTVGNRLKQLRAAANLSQIKMSELNGYRQSNIARYENGKAVQPFRMLVWYADYFNVSMDYIFGRTDNPEGRLYDYNPQINTSSDELKKFIEMCFDPTSPVSEKMKSTLFELFNISATPDCKKGEADK